MLTHGVHRLRARQITQGGAGRLAVARDRAEPEVVGHQRVHAVDRDELLGEREPDAVEPGP